MPGGTKGALKKKSGLKPQQTRQKSRFTRNYSGVKKGERWKDEYYVTIFLLAKQGMTDTKISGALGVDLDTFRKWRDSNPAVRKALDQGRTKENGAGDLAEYVHGRLPPELQPLWDKIMRVDELKVVTSYSKKKRLDRMLQDCGKRVKQQLWLHALVHSNFNKFEACRKVGISRGLVQVWINEDPRFLELVDMIVDMKKDFVEGCLFGLIGQGDVTATVFAAKTLLRDRGYDSRVTIVHDGVVKHAHVDMNRVLDSLSVESKKELLRALDAQKTDVKALPPRVVQVTPELVEDDDDDS